MKQNIFVCLDKFYGSIQKEEGRPERARIINPVILRKLREIIKERLILKGAQVSDASITFFTKKEDRVRFHRFELEFLILNTWISAEKLEALMKSDLLNIGDSKYLSKLTFTFVDHAHSHKVKQVDIYPSNEILSSSSGGSVTSRDNSLGATPDQSSSSSSDDEVSVRRKNPLKATAIPQPQVVARKNVQAPLPANHAKPSPNKHATFQLPEGYKPGGIVILKDEAEKAAWRASKLRK